MNQLSADYTPVSDEIYLKIRENENLNFDLGLTMNGTISGLVFADTNVNGKLDENEEPVKLVGVSLLETNKTAYTSHDGNFYLENIPLGEYTLKVQKESIPESMKTEDEGVYQIKITKEALDKRNISIPLIYQYKD